MKKTFKFFAAALAIVAAASCAKEINVDTPVDDSAEKVYMTFTASYDAEGETKTVLAENNFIHWTDEDAIRIFSKDKSGDWNMNDEVFAIDPSSNDADPTFGDFSGNVVPSTSYIAATPAYGWSVYNGPTKYIEFEGLANQIAVEGAFDPSMHLALSVSLKENHFYFQNACALLKVKIGNNLEDVYSIQVTGSKVETPFGDAALGGKLSYRVGDLYPNKTSASSNTITLKKSNANESLKKNVDYYIVVPICDVENFTVTMLNKNGQAVSTKSKSNKFEIKRNKIYDLGTFDYQLKVGDYYYSDGTTGVAYKSNAVGVVFYVGNPHEVDSTLPSECTKGLVVGLEEIGNVAFDSGPSLKGTSNFQPDYYYSNISTKNTSDFGNTTTAKALIAESKAYKLTVLHKNTNTSLYQSYALSSRTQYGSGWYIPSCKEYSLMYQAMSVLNAKDNFTDLRSWGSSDKTTVFSNLSGSPCFGYHTVWQANLENGWRCVNYYYLSDSKEEGIYPTVVRQPNSNHGYPHIGRIIFAF